MVLIVLASLWLYLLIFSHHLGIDKANFAATLNCELEINMACAINSWLFMRFTQIDNAVAYVGRLCGM